MCSNFCCDVNYKMRKVHSKGALLIVVWTFFFSLSVWSFFRLAFFSIINKIEAYGIVAAVLLGLLFACGPLTGWLADDRLGNYTIFKIGNGLIFAASALRCIFTLILENVDLNRISSDVSFVVLTIVYGMMLIGGIACLISTLKLGLDQMPDASSENITSLIAWCSIFITGGLWFGELSISLAGRYLEIYGVEPSKLVRQISSSFPVISASCMCSLMFLFSKWLIIEPRSPKVLKAIYRVLQFTWKHKTPLNRSALTYYWEENIPSRMDLGKSRFGGPFTTEQVEDVKTFFKILVFFFPIAIVSFSFSSTQGVYFLQTLNITRCASGLAYNFGYSTMISTIVTFLVYELMIYRFIRNKLPNILKRIGMTSLAILVINIVHSTVNIAGLKYNVGGYDWIYMAYCILIGPIGTCLMTQITEFICAQSPYKMHGLLTGYGMFTFLTPFYLGRVANTLFEWHYICDKNQCIIIQNCLSVAMSSTGFVLYCLVAHWYKTRVRDEEYDVHRVVEEVYDRYLSTQNS